MKKIQSRTKQSLYVPDAILAELQHEAERLDRTHTWLLEKAWQLSRQKIKSYPSVPNEPSAR